MKNNPAVSEGIVAFLEANPGSRLGEIQKHVLGLGLSTEKGIQNVIHHLVKKEALKVDRTKYNAFRYSINDETRHVIRVEADRFEIPADLAGPIVPPLVWSMRHLLGAAV